MHAPSWASYQDDPKFHLPELGAHLPELVARACTGKPLVLDNSDPLRTKSGLEMLDKCSTHSASTVRPYLDSGMWKRVREHPGPGA